MNTFIENLVVMRNSVKNTTNKNYKRSKCMNNFIFIKKLESECKNLFKKKIPDLHDFACEFSKHIEQNNIKSICYFIVKKK